MYLQSLGTSTDTVIPTSILSSFPLLQRRTICSSIILSLVSDKLQKSAESLTSRAHVDWTTEVIGHSFQLPLNQKNDITTVSAALRLYRSWLGLDVSKTNSTNTTTTSNNNSIGTTRVGPAQSIFGNLLRRPKSGSHESPVEKVQQYVIVPKRPRGVETSLQHYTKEMLSQMTTLFLRRDELLDNKEQHVTQQQHVDLCLQALQIYRDIADPCNKVILNQDVWEVLLKITLGITIHVLGSKDEIKLEQEEEENEEETKLKKKSWRTCLGGTLIATVTQVWLHSTGNIHGKLKNDMWCMFVQKFSTKCLTTIIAIEQYHAVLLHTMSSVTSLLWQQNQERKEEQQKEEKNDNDVLHLIRVVWPHALLSNSMFYLKDTDLIQVWSNFHQCLSLPSSSASSNLSNAMTKTISDLASLLIATRNDGKLTLLPEIQAKMIRTMSTLHMGDVHQRNRKSSVSAGVKKEVLAIVKRNNNITTPSETARYPMTGFRSTPEHSNIVNPLNAMDALNITDTVNGQEQTSNLDTSRRDQDVNDVENVEDVDSSKNTILNLRKLFRGVSQPGPAETKSILILFGGFLFDAAEDEREDRLASRATALKSLCRIMSGHGAKSTLVTNQQKMDQATSGDSKEEDSKEDSKEDVIIKKIRVRFYNTIITALQHGHPSLVSSILDGSEGTLFSRGLPGVRCLIPAVMPHVVSLLDCRPGAFGTCPATW